MEQTILRITVPMDTLTPQHKQQQQETSRPLEKTWLNTKVTLKVCLSLWFQVIKYRSVFKLSPGNLQTTHNKWHKSSSHYNCYDIFTICFAILQTWFGLNVIETRCRLQIHK